VTLEMARYIGLFVAEATEHLAKLGSELVRLESAAREGADLVPIVDGLFRHAHSVKGMSASMQLEGIAALAHRVEDLVAVFRQRAAAPDAASVDVLLAAVDALQKMVEAALEGVSSEPDAELMSRLAAAADGARAQGAADPAAAPSARAPATRAAAGFAIGDIGGSAPDTPSCSPPPEPRVSGPNPRPGEREASPGGARRRVAVDAEVAASCPVPSVRGFLVLKKLARLGAVVSSSPSLQDLKSGRIPGRRLEVIIDTAEPLAAVERTLAQVSDLESTAVREDTAARPKRPPAPPPAREERESAAEGGRAVRVRVDLLDSFLDAVGELILATARVRELGRAVPEPQRVPLMDGVDRLHATVRDLHDRVMAVRMTPLAAVTDRLPRAARDLARRTGKQVEVEIRGAEIEIDRAILDELADPLLHVLRNAVDHGLEAPHLRLLAGKPATGRVAVTARRERDRVLVEVADDGKGMSAAKLRAAAVARGALSRQAAAALLDRDALLLACLPGVSTAEEVTEVSGRGVGMDAVKRAVEALGGALEVESAVGDGTRWTLRLPLTVAVQPVLLVRVAGEVLGLPIAKVHGAAQVDLSRLERSQGAPVLPYAGRLVPVKDLAHLLGFHAPAAHTLRSVVVADGEGAQVGLAVDALIGQEEAVLKPLARPLDRVPGLSAVTVLGNGKPVFILDVQRLLAA
jgi:two-component system chemotaxis sensor kinase CheA